MAIARNPLSLWLDHASVVVPNVPQAVQELESRLGLRANLTPADPARHSRVHLDRSYLEIAAQGDASGWSIPWFFLRFEDLSALRRHLEATGLACRISEYAGVDGRWDDVEVDAGPVPMPILVRRTHPPEIARDWPPPMRTAHPCGARFLDAVHVTVPNLTVAIRAYSRLIGIESVSTSAERDTPRAEFRLAAGRVVLIEGTDPGVNAIVLGVASLAEAAKAVALRDEAPVAWLDPVVTHGARIGFTERRPA